MVEQNNEKPAAEQTTDAAAGEKTENAPKLVLDEETGEMVSKK